MSFYICIFLWPNGLFAYVLKTTNETNLNGKAVFLLLSLRIHININKENLYFWKSYLTAFLRRLAAANVYLVCRYVGSVYVLLM